MKALRKCHTGSKSGEVTTLELKNRAVSRKAATEGMVLLKNDGVLPLKAGSAVALFGGGAGHTIKGGTGSGDVNERASVTVYQGLEDAGFTITSKAWLSDYDTTYLKAREAWKQKILDGMTEEAGLTAVFEKYAKNPFALPDGRAVSKDDCIDAKAAIYVVSRIAGEGADRRLEKGDYYLSDQEAEDIRFLSAVGIPVILLLNAGGPVELTDILPCVSAVLNISQPGQEGGHAIADVLSGVVAPSGKLTTTWASRYADYPSAQTFGGGASRGAEEFYSEGVYVGYRYFDTFQVKPLFPFGFGLSYTLFTIRSESVSTDKNGVTVTATVTNTGDNHPGREVVQIYVSCPQTGLPKEYRRLLGFAKTKLLAPGESETITISAPAKAFASYSEEKAAWLVEAGRYGLWLGHSSSDLTLAGVFRVSEETVIEQAANICPLQRELSELKSPDSVLQREKDWQTDAAKRGLMDIPFTPAKNVKIVYETDEIDHEAAELAERLPADELIPMLYGEISGANGALGSAGTKVPGSAGETCGKFLEKLGVPGIVLSDGPAGLRLKKSYEVDRTTDEPYPSGILDGLEGGYFREPETHPDADVYYQYCTAFPIGTLLAQSFDPGLLEEVGKAVAEELELYHTSWWLAPGMNIQRNPLCGRNFEYYSEDPLVSGLMAAAVTRGVQSGNGVGTTIKHFACNNREENRMGTDAILSERALREIYLRGFEIAVRESQPMAIMSAYNLINGVHAANSHDLCTTVARDEWNFRGIIMTDWTATHPAGGSIAWQCAEAGNDLIMPGYAGDDENLDENLRAALNSGELSENAIRCCAERLFNIILRTNSYEGATPYERKPIQ